MIRGELMKKLLWLAVLLAVGCDDGSSDGEGGAGGEGGGADMAQVDLGPPDLGPTLDDTSLALEADCDPLVPAHCALPWPSDKFLVPDETRDSGYRLEFGADTLPANKQGIGIDPTPYQILDGYGVGAPLMVILPNLDPDQLLGERDIADTIGPDADIVWLEVTDAGTRRIPYYAEADPAAEDDAEQIVFVRPAEILKENTRYVVAFRNLVDRDGARVLPSKAFAALRDGVADRSEYPNLGDRQARFDTLFADLEAEGVDRATLQLAWSFNTASSKSLHGDMLDVRRKGFEAAGPDGPELTLDTVEEYTEEQNEHIWLNIEGTMRVPHFMEEWGENRFGQSHFNMHRGDDGRPTQNGWRDAEVWIRVPHSAKSGRPHGLVLYGHGQQGRGSQVRGGDKGPVANGNDLIFFACDLVGMSRAEENLTPSILLDMNFFPWISERLHQGLLEYLLLVKAMMHRAADTEAFSARGVQVDPSRVYYSGISQGGIFGGTFMALSTDVMRGHLGVPGVHYATLINRSRNFAVLGMILAGGYDTINDRRVVMMAVQQLWNRTDPVSYYRHISAEPFEDDPPRQVLLAPAKGDPQVSVLTTEVVARSGLGVEVLENYDVERTVPLTEPVPFPHTGSGLVLWSYGNPWPAPGAQPPVDDGMGDPHGKPRKDDEHNRQMVHFWETGEIIDVCNGAPCVRE